MVVTSTIASSAPVYVAATAKSPPSSTSRPAVLVFITWIDLVAPTSSVTDLANARAIERSHARFDQALVSFFDQQ